jgi:hypothetical protein
MNRAAFAVLVVLGLGAAGCKTITEDLPTKPTATGGNPAVTVPLPVTVTPVAIPQAQPAPTPTPASGGGSTGGGSAQTPPASGDGSIPDNIPDNTEPVAYAYAKVYFVECDGQQVPGSELATEAPVGCRVHLDVTPKDKSYHLTQTKHDPQWNYSDPGLFGVSGRSAFNPVLEVHATGSTSVQAIVDGIASNTFTIRFTN